MKQSNLLFLKQENLHSDEKKIGNGYAMYFMGYAESNIVQDFKSYLKTDVNLVEVDLELMFKKHISQFVPHEVTPGIYTLTTFRDHFRTYNPSDFNLIMMTLA